MRSALPASRSVASNPRSAIVAKAAYSPIPRRTSFARGWRTIAHADDALRERVVVSLHETRRHYEHAPGAPAIVFVVPGGSVGSLRCTTPAGMRRLWWIVQVGRAYDANDGARIERIAGRGLHAVVRTERNTLIGEQCADGRGRCHNVAPLMAEHERDGHRLAVLDLHPLAEGRVERR